MTISILFQLLRTFSTGVTVYGISLVLMVCVDDTRQALFLDGMLRFPLVVSYCFLGVCLGAYAMVHPGFVAGFPLNETGTANYNLAVPIFVLKNFPHGLIGLVIVGLVAAAMSSLDSTLNALSALINGPLLAVFLMGMLTRRINGQGALCGLIAGFSGNLWLWRYAPNISWLWWNVIGFLVAYTAGYVMSLVFPTPQAARLAGTLYRRDELQRSAPRRNWQPYYIILALYGTGIFALLVIVTLVF